MSRTSRIDFELVRTIAGEFPGGSWQRLDCASLHRPTELNPRAREWELLTHVHKKGGNYAFLFPEAHFAEERQILLDGPAQPFSERWSFRGVCWEGSEFTPEISRALRPNEEKHCRPSAVRVGEVGRLHRPPKRGRFHAQARDDCLSRAFGRRTHRE